MAFVTYKYASCLQKVQVFEPQAHNEKNLIGIKMELDVNKQLLEVENSVIYWSIQFEQVNQLFLELTGVEVSETYRAPLKKFLELDHLVVTPTCVFIIETKGYASKDVTYEFAKKFFADPQLSNYIVKDIEKTGEEEYLPNPIFQILMQQKIWEDVFKKLSINIPLIPIVCMRKGTKIKDEVNIVRITDNENIAAFLNEIAQSFPTPSIHDALVLMSFFEDNNIFPSLYNDWKKYISELDAAEIQKLKQTASNSTRNPQYPDGLPSFPESQDPLARLYKNSKKLQKGDKQEVTPILEDDESPEAFEEDK
jgi:hypothetical protein